MKIFSKAPCRVDLAGGTLDIWPLYLYHANAVTLNFAVNRYASCTLETRTDSQIVLRSRDLGGRGNVRRSGRAAVREAIQAAAAGLCGEILRAAGRHRAVHRLGSAGGRGYFRLLDADHRDRLGAEQADGRGYTIEKLREIAQNIEAQIIRVPTGAQDYYPAMYGGVSAIELSPLGIVRKAIPVDLRGSE